MVSSCCAVVDVQTGAPHGAIGAVDLGLDSVRDWDRMSSREVEGVVILAGFEKA